jgi:hypothetical protein
MIADIFANNHRTRCNLSPINVMELYNPQEEQLADVYVMEKIGTKQGWSRPSPDENWMFGWLPSGDSRLYGSDYHREGT